MTTGNDIAIALRAAYLALHRRSEAAFAPHGVTADQFVLLATLARGGTPSPSGNSPAACRPTPAPCGRCSSCWSSADWSSGTRTRPTPAKRTVALTAKGKRTFRRLWAAGEPIRARMLGALRPGEAETLVGLLTQVAEVLNAEYVAIGGSASSHLPRGRTMSGRIVALLAWVVLAG